MRGWKDLQLIICFALFAGARLSGQVTWQTAIGGFGSDVGHSVRQTRDLGYIVCGSTGSFGEGGDIYLLKLDETGAREWTTTIGGTGVDAGSAVRELPDSGFVVVGSSEFGGGYDGLVVRLDKDGAQQWERRIGTQDWDFFLDVEPTSDGFIVVGSTYGLGAGDSDAWILKLDLAGDTVWTTLLGGTQADQATCVRLTPDGGFIVAGSATSQSWGQDALIAKYDASGSEEWSTTMRGADTDEGLSATPLADGGYLIGGDSHSFGPDQDLFFAKLNGAGDSLWMRNVGGGAVDWQGGEIRELSDGRLCMIASTTAFGAGGKDAYLLFTDNEGYWVFGPSFGGTSDDTGMAMDLTEDGGYVFVGTTYSFGPGANSVFIVKTDGDTLQSPVLEDLDPLGIRIAGLDVSVLLYPNPMVAGTLLHIPQSKDRTEHITFFDVSGRIAFEAALLVGEDHITVPESLRGIYRILMTTSSGTCLRSSLVIME